MKVSSNCYKLHKVKKHWVTVMLTTVAGLVLMMVGTSSASADSTSSASQNCQIITVVQQSNDENQGIASSQDNALSNSTELAENQPEEVPWSQSDVPTQQEEKKKLAVDSTSENGPAQTDSTNQASSTGLKAPASDGAVVVQQKPQSEKQAQEAADTTTSSSSDSVVTDNLQIVSDSQRADINKILDGSSSGISTLDAAVLTYEFEKARLKGASDADILAKIQEAGRAVPNNLTYLSDFYDNQTGTSGVAFQDKASNKVIIAYTGTNNDSNQLQDALGADVMGIGLARGQHYQPAYDFYDKIARQYGSQNVVITGHSLGGNVAQRVALKKNAETTVVYNAAPLYIPAVASVGNRLYDSLRIKFDLPSNQAEAKKTIADIKSDMKTFTGKVTRITTTKDWLNNTMRWLGAIYLGKEYVIPNSGNHDLENIAKDTKQVASVKQWTTI